MAKPAHLCIHYQWPAAAGYRPIVWFLARVYHPSIHRVDHTKMVEDSIINFSPFQSFQFLQGISFIQNSVETVLFYFK